MNKSNYTIKDYKNDLNKIYQIKDDEIFKTEINKLYKKKDIYKSWKGKRLKQLLDGNKKHIEVLVLILSNLLSALITTTITFTRIDQVMKKGFDEIAQMLFEVCLTFLVVGVVVLLVALVIVVPFIMWSISSKQIDRNNYEMSQLIEKLSKKSLFPLLEKNKESKKMLAKRLICGTITGVAIPIVATIIVLFVK